MMFWTFMNVDNLTAAQKMELLRASLRNTADVVIEGNPEDGWTLVSWDGREFSPQRTFGAEVKLQQRTLRQQLMAVSQSIRDAFATRDPATIATALNQGISTAKFSVIKYQRAVKAEFIASISKALSEPAAAQASVSQASTGTAEQATVTESVSDASDARPDTEVVASKADSASKRKASSIEVDVEVESSPEAAGTTDPADDVDDSRLEVEQDEEAASVIEDDSDANGADDDYSRDATDTDTGSESGAGADAGADSAGGAESSDS